MYKLLNQCKYKKLQLWSFFAAVIFFIFQFSSIAQEEEDQDPDRELGITALEKGYYTDAIRHFLM